MVGIPAASANAVFHATDRPSGSCRLRRTSCCKAVKGANNLNREPSAAQKMLSVKARVGALYSGSFHALSCREELVAEIRRGVQYTIHTNGAPAYGHGCKVEGRHGYLIGVSEKNPSRRLDK